MNSFFCSLPFGFNCLACRSYIRESRARTRSDSVRKERFKIMLCVQIWWVWVYQYPGVWSEGSVFVEDLATGGPCSPPQPDMGRIQICFLWFKWRPLIWSDIQTPICVPCQKVERANWPHREAGMPRQGRFPDPSDHDPSPGSGGRRSPSSCVLPIQSWQFKSEIVWK